MVELHSRKLHVIHGIRRTILLSKYCNETMESIEHLTLDEVFWLFEQLTLRDKYEDAYYKDEKHQERLNQ